ncbi:MAG: lysine--tRNA ligase, partial [Thermoflexales bacterium]|nr:lysine--tRNA ligase [Thermoflexales bacterium]
MLWFDQIAEKLDPSRAYIVNDSKTPSGRVHVGALRGVVIHDVVYRALKSRGFNIRYTYGVDDYDPLDEIPKGQDEFFRPHLGKPLCNVPAPPGSPAADVAEHFISEFFGVFDELAVGAERYWMRNLYRSGKLNEVIDTMLRNAATIRRVRFEISGSKRAETWHPFQVVCENCGRIGTTEVVGYDGKEVEYHCRPSLVKWAQGCGHHGKMSPFDGNGKMPWNIEWIAKWVTFPVSIEGAGKDHSTAGGSREVSEATMRAIYPDKTPPVNIPYEFFLVGGKKMSSSKGVGASARDMANFLPPELLRFVMLRTQPQQPVDFAADEEFMVKLFNDYDRVHARAFDPSLEDVRAVDDRRVFAMSQVSDEARYYDANFQLVTALVQLPGMDVEAEIARRKGAPLTDADRAQLGRRVQAARVWLDHYAADDEKIVVRETLPERAQALTAAQRACLHGIADGLAAAPQDDEALQGLVFDVARMTPLPAGDAFKAIYRVLLDRESGPRAGSLLAFLDRGFVTRRFRELPVDHAALLRETAVPVAEFARALRDPKAKVAAVSAAGEA